MYWKLFREKVERRFSRRRRASTLRNGAVALFLLVVFGTVFADYEKGRGDYTRLKNTLIPPPKEQVQYRPGGKEAIVLSRSALEQPTPEFLSVTLLPGRGMDVLQITANLPGKGEVKLLASTDLAEAAGAMTGKGDDEAGGANLTRGGAFLMPWAGRLGVTIGPDERSATAIWRGRALKVPVHRIENGLGGTPVAYGGLLLKSAASRIDINPMPDGGQVSATFPSGEEDARWPSKTETTVSALLASRAVELSVKVRNIGAEATPVGIGWAPRFVIPSGQRAKASLRVPASMREVTAQNDGAMPTGELDAVKGTAYDFNVPGGTELGSHGLDDTFVHLNSAFDNHPTIELRDPEAKVGLRISALSTTIKAVHVSSPENSQFVAISPQMNYDDPFSKKWPPTEDTGMVVLQPGHTVEWKVRLELFAILPSLLKRQ